MDYPPVEVQVWGDWACFTRPELKAERVSYPTMTPSAARGVLESIFWKPEFSWRIREIHVLRHPTSAHLRAEGRIMIEQNADDDMQAFYRHFSLMRNEVDRRATGTPISITDCRVQRHTLALRDVAYLIRADVALRSNTEADPAKYRDQFRRRVQQGKCHSRPYLGCREFACDFAPPDDTVDKRKIRHSEAIDLGLMLFDVLRSDNGECVPLFFQAELKDGVLHVPDVLYGRYGS